MRKIMSLFKKENLPLIVAVVVSLSLFVGTVLMLPATTSEQTSENSDGLSDAGADASVVVDDAFVPVEETTLEADGDVVVLDEMAVVSATNDDDDDEDAGVVNDEN